MAWTPYEILDTLRGTEGVDASGPDEAVEEARAVLEDMRENEDLRGNEEAVAPRGGRQPIIRDERGTTPRAISFGHSLIHEPDMSVRAAGTMAEARTCRMPETIRRSSLRSGPPPSANDGAEAQSQSVHNTMVRFKP